MLAVKEDEEETVVAEIVAQFENGFMLGSWKKSNIYFPVRKKINFSQVVIQEDRFRQVILPN
jgi:hypothetical protein